jgi:NADH:ubiquinone oxidoreductase subunit F (NADH-binding)/NAD-dependent dihydropyrimidine dehydrogenase PreA subunit/(2Fe-2S) ferredoxin
MIDVMLEFDVEKAKRQLEGDRITVGLAICGVSSGGMPVFEALKGAELGIPVERVGCIGMCYNEPIVTVRQNGKQAVYGKVTKGNVNKLIACIKKGAECRELFVCHDLSELEFYRKQKRLVMSNCGVIDPLNINQYVSSGGYMGLSKALRMKPADVIEEVKKSGLRGRGGAGFPTWMKWNIIAGKQGKKYLVCNADEGDPGAFMNKTVVVSDPFRVIEGITIGAHATGADEGTIYARAESPLSIQTIEKAIETAYRKNLLGKNIMGIRGFSFNLRLQRGAGAFVCGEETALMQSIEGRRGMPRPRPPFPAEKGLYGRPTVINNVGTWAHVATIFRMGAAEYAKIGTEKTKGTKEICLAGNVKRGGVIEVPIGTTIREIVYDIGGGCPDGTEFKAVLTGGPAGGCVPRELMDTPVDYEPLQALGSIMGSGGMIVLTDNDCMVDTAKFFMGFTQSESCGKCTPCREGTKRLLEMLTNITRGAGKQEDIDRILKLSEYVRDNSLCGLGQNAPNPVISTIRFFRKEYEDHIKNGKCYAGKCTNLVKYFITKKCIGCGNCARHCPAGCISGRPKKMYMIDQSRCTRCGICYDVCAFRAIRRE